MFTAHRLLAPLVVACLLPACASHEGTYAPDCVAYAGDRIRLEDSRFVWDKFTDEIRVDDAGRKIDPFPEYPVRGRYRIDDGRVVFEAESGKELPEMHLRSEGGRSWLLTAAQLAAWEETGASPDCPLILGGDS